jgi:hypothetical protein
MTNQNQIPKPEIVSLPNEIVSVTPIVCKNCGSDVSGHPKPAR